MKTDLRGIALFKEWAKAKGSKKQDKKRVAREGWGKMMKVEGGEAKGMTVCG